MTTAARAAGVPRRTVYSWRKRSVEFELAFQDAEQEASDRLEMVLWQLATGMPMERVKTELLRGRDGRPLKHPQTGEDWYVVSEITRTTEYSTGALIALLKARNPAKYRESYDLKYSGELGLITLEELDRRLTLIREYEPPVASLPPPALPPGERTFSDSQQHRYLRP